MMLVRFNMAKIPSVFGDSTGAGQILKDGIALASTEIAFVWKSIGNICYLILLTWFLTGCDKEQLIPDPPSPDDGNQPSLPIPEASDVNKFIYNGLSTYYLWEDMVPNLNRTVFEKNKDSLNAFLNRYTDPEALFTSLLYQYKTIDKWSFIVDDAKEIDNWIAGISETMGFKFGLNYVDQNSNHVVGSVRYVFKGSPAEKAGIRRGDLFMTIDGEQLTASNYYTLLYTKKTYTLGLASKIGDRLLPDGRTATMTAVMMQENPVYLDTVLNVNGLKVGYLVYNGFTASYDSLIQTTYDILLNRVFGNFKKQGIQKLILDLRYNGGGSVQTTAYLASMIHSTDTRKVFFKTRYNSLLQSYYQQKYGLNYFIDYFQDRILPAGRVSGEPINSLGMNEVYIITSSSTASASELLINGLKPYMTVKQIGDNTTGKYVGSFTIKDWIDNNGAVNPSHSWAMQPITLKMVNSREDPDYIQGLIPVVKITESVLSLKPFGDPEEVLLKACLNDIKGVKSAWIQAGPVLKPFRTSDDFSPFSQLMYVNPEKWVGNRFETYRQVLLP